MCEYDEIEYEHVRFSVVRRVMCDPTAAERGGLTRSPWQPCCVTVGGPHTGLRLKDVSGRTMYSFDSISACHAIVVVAEDGGEAELTFDLSPNVALVLRAARNVTRAIASAVRQQTRAGQPSALADQPRPPPAFVHLSSRVEAATAALHRSSAALPPSRSCMLKTGNESVRTPSRLFERPPTALEQRLLHATPSLAVRLGMEGSPPLY